MQVSSVALTSSIPINNLDSKIKSTIDQTITILNKCSIYDFIRVNYHLRKIKEREYQVFSSQNDVYQLNQLQSNVCLGNWKDVAKNIDLLINCPDQFLASDQKQKVKEAMIRATSDCVEKIVQFEDLIDLASILNYIDFQENSSTHLIVEELIERLIHCLNQNKINRIYTKASDHAWGAFSFKRILHDKKNKLYAAFSACLFNKTHDLSSLDLSLATCGLAVSRFINPGLFNKLRTEAINKQNLFTINEKINTIWACCYIGWKTKIDPALNRTINDQLINAFMADLIKQLPKANVDQVVRLAWSLKNINRMDADFFQAVRGKILADKDLLAPASLVNITKLLSNLHSIDDFALIQLLEMIADKIDGPNCLLPSQLTDISYAVLIKFCLQDDHFSFYDQFITKILIKLNVDYQSLTTDQRFEKIQELEVLRILTIVYAQLTEQDSQQVIGCLGSLTQDILKLKPTTESSKFHKDVAKHLNVLISSRSLSINFVNEFLLDDYFSLDIAFPDYQLAIELDGECHFDEMGNYMPKNIIKETFLKIHGWKLLRIKRSDWPKNDNGQELNEETAKQEMLTQTLATIPAFHNLFLAN